MSHPFTWTRKSTFEHRGEKVDVEIWCPNGETLLGTATRYVLAAGGPKSLALHPFCGFIGFDTRLGKPSDEPGRLKYEDPPYFDDKDKALDWLVTP